MSKYVGVKIVTAEPMTAVDFSKQTGKATPGYNGYKLTYPDGYVSWSPKDVFEKAYMQVGDKNKIEQQNVNDFIKSYDVSQWGDKTTIVHATLANGFIITESSSCVDVKNFDMDIGANICKERIQNKVWELLGFTLQSAVKGIK